TSHLVIYTLSLHDALPIYSLVVLVSFHRIAFRRTSLFSSSNTKPCICPEKLRPSISSGFPLNSASNSDNPAIVCFTQSLGSCSRSEEHTSELQSRIDLVCS